MKNLESNWSIGSAREFGKARVIRQRIGLAPKRKSVATHKCLTIQVRENLCARLEVDAAKRAAFKARFK
jgi:hypothetical protein